MPSDLPAASRVRARAVGLLTRRPSWGAVIGVVVAGAGFVLGARPLRDNSFLTHLATGRLILDTGSVPSHDPYTLTAGGEPWVVQSWLVSVAYATVEALGGLTAVRVLGGLLVALVVVIGWRLLRSADSLVPRLALMALFLVVCAQSWAERPLMVGLVAFGVVMLCVEERWDPRWLAPLGWVWANSHGSHPLGVAYLLLLIAGARLDRCDDRHERRALGWLVVGVLLGVVGPLGVEVLRFPVRLLTRREVLSGVIEWRAPTYDELGQQAFVVALVLTVLALVRRPSYRRALVAAAFAAAAITSLRNVPVAMLVVLPVLADAVGEVGSLRSSIRPAIGRFAVVSLAALAVLVGVLRVQSEPLDLRAYPIEPLARWEQEGRPGLLVTEDFVGNLQTFVYGADAASFYDDRFDMFPDDLTEQYRAVAAAGPRSRSTLDALGADAVLWERRDPIVSVLLADPAWRADLIDDRWVLLRRRAG